jgi:apolipoprotein N-acyltransferase
VTFRLLTLQFIWRPRTRGVKVFRYQRRTISGNAQLFRYTYSIFFLWNLAGSYWLLVAALRAPALDDTLILGAAAVLALLINPALMSIPCQIYSRTRHVLPPVIAAGSFIVFWLTFEYLQFNWELSYSWLTLGHSLANYPLWIQYAEFTGVLGISLHILVANLLVYRAYRYLDHEKKLSWLRLGIALAWIALPFLFNIPLLSEDRPIFQTTDRMRVRLVQPSLDPHRQEELYTSEEKVNLFASLAESDSLKEIDLIILPEKAIPRPLNRRNAGRDRLLDPLWAQVDSHQLDILTGLESYTSYPSQDSAPAGATPGFAIGDSGRQAAWIATWNSATLLRADRQLAFYDKGRLAPLVERIPYLSWFGVFNQLFPGWWSGMGNYALQDSLVLPETSNGHPLAVLLSYESAFGAYAGEAMRAGGEALIIITNNRWWSGTAGYEQHEWFSVLRAIENRRSVLRSANLGGSRFVNARGQSQELPNSEEAQIADFTIDLHQGATFYMEHGDWIGRWAGWLTVLIILVSLYLNFTPRKKQKRTK